MTERAEIELEDEHDRYHRQSLISWWDQERLSSARVIVVGAGALGNEIVKNLALIGIGQITLIDLDRIENSNLSRCVFFREADEGRFKAEVVAERAQELNPATKIIPVVGDVRLKLGLVDFAEADVVLGGLDNREARLFVNRACWKTSTPWVDGAIEGLMGVVRVFMPPDTACYECTMSERDHELIAARRTCALLSRDEMLEGKVPTTATSSSVVAAIQAQEAVKLLHHDRLGAPTLAGAGLNFVGLTHDSYVVQYSQREDCLSHDTYDLSAAKNVDEKSTFADLLGMAKEALGDAAILDLEHEVVLTASCSACETSEVINLPVDALTAGSGTCPTCGQERKLDFTHSITEGSPLLTKRPDEIGLPDRDVVTGRVGLERIFLLTGGGIAGRVSA